MPETVRVPAARPAFILYVICRYEKESGRHTAQCNGAAWFRPASWMFY
jgi:hypothetical protein